MQITNRNNQSFKAVPLYSLNLLKKTNKGVEVIPAVVSRLVPMDEADSKTICDIGKIWKNSSVKSLYYDYFKNKPNCYLSGESSSKVAKWDVLMMEFVGNEPASQRALGLAKTKFFDDTYELSNLQTNPEYQHPSSLCRLLGQKSDSREIKNIGRLMFGSILSEAKKLEAQNMYFFSVVDAFYKRITKDAKICLIGNQSSFHIDSVDFEKYIKFCRDKFNFSEIGKN